MSLFFAVFLLVVGLWLLFFDDPFDDGCGGVTTADSPDRIRTPVYPKDDFEARDRAAYPHAWAAHDFLVGRL